MSTAKPKKVSIKEYTRRRKIWLDALESGKFEQATMQLEYTHKTTTLKGKPKISHAYCCLGVACKVLGKEAGIKRGIEKDTQMVAYNDETGDAPFELGEYLGFRGALTKKAKAEKRTVGGSFKRTLALPNNLGGDKMSASSLIQLNDSLRWDFKQIADFIRKNPHQIWERGTYKPVTKKNSRV